MPVITYKISSTCDMIVHEQLFCMFLLFVVCDCLQKLLHPPGADAVDVRSCTAMQQDHKQGLINSAQRPQRSTTLLVHGRHLGGIGLACDSA